MTSSWVAMRTLVERAVGGGWGLDAPEVGTEQVAVIRGADFPAVAIGDTSRVPVRWEATRNIPQRKLEVGDIVLEISGGTSDRPTGRTIYISEGLLEGFAHSAIPASFCRLVRINKNIADPHYVYWWLQGMYTEGRTWSYQNRSTGIANFQFEHFLDTEKVQLPARHVQIGIAATLGALDDKIDSIRKVRELAQELLRSMYVMWFRDYIPWGGQAPDSWQRGKLHQILTLVKDSTRPGVHDLPYVPIDTIPMNSLGLDGVRSNEDAKSSLQVFQQDDILVGAMRVYFHRVALAPFGGLTRNTTFVLRAADPAYLEYALLLCDQDSTIDFAQGVSKGSTMPYAVWDGGLAEMPIHIPTRSDVELFSKEVRHLVEIVRDSFVKSTKLAELRDALLPELLSGRIRVHDVEATES